MKTQNNVPQLRFPGFSGEWEDNKLGEVAEIGRGKSKHRPRDAGFLYGGEYPFIQTGDIKKAELYLYEYSQTYSEEGLKQSKLWSEGTLCVTIAANIAETAILKIKACFPDSIIGITPHFDKTNVLFIKYLFDKFKIQIQNLSQGVAQENLNLEKLCNISFSFPTLPEQEKIANFFMAVDEKLKALKKKKTLLEQYKKGIMQRIFSQELRFRDDKGKPFPAWEMRKLGEVASKQSSSISFNDTLNNVGTYILYGASGIIKSIDYYEVDSDYISIVKDGAGVGRLLYCNGKSSVLGTMDILKPNLNIHTYFLYCILSNVDFQKYITGSTIPHIYFKDYKNENVPIPSLPEQEKIAKFLSAVDEKIVIVQKEIERLEEWKRGLLQRLFV